VAEAGAAAVDLVAAAGMGLAEAVGVDLAAGTGPAEVEGFTGSLPMDWVAAVVFMGLLLMVAWLTWVMDGAAMHWALTAFQLIHMDLLVTPRAATAINSLPIMAVTITR